MTDIIDDAQQREDFHREQSIAAARTAKPVAAAEGYCLECGEDLPDTRRWCDAKCRDAWEHRR